MCKNTMYFAHSRCVRTLRTLYVYATGYLCVPVETESQSYMEYTHVLNYRVKATFHYSSQLQTWSKTLSQAGRKHVESQLRTSLKRFFFYIPFVYHAAFATRFSTKKSKAGRSVLQTRMNLSKTWLQTWSKTRFSARFAAG